MPTFKWNAIDLSGKVCRGVDFAISAGELQQILQRRKLGLMFCAIVRKDFMVGQIKLLDQLNFFHDLRALLLAGMMLPQALLLFLNQNKNIALRCVVGYLLYQVQDQGANFGQVLQQFRPIFGNLVTVVLQAGFAVGNLSQALQNVCDYLAHRLQMQRELRRAILLPALTLLLFMGIALLVFVVIVPQFAQIFNNAKIPLDQSTKTVLALSAFLRSKEALIYLLVFWLVGLLGYVLLQTKLGKLWFHTLLLQLPLIGKLIRYQNLFSFMQAAALLITGGLPVTEAFACASSSIGNVRLQRQVVAMTHLVEQGTPVSVAMQQAAPQFLVSEVIAMVAVGEESGCLGTIFSRIAEVYQQRFRALLQTLLTLLQPILIIALGGLVALLIFAIYVPIFNMPAIME